MFTETQIVPYSDPGRQRQYQREWIAARRHDWLLQHGPCVKCGSWDRLQVDHVDPAQKVNHRVWSWRKEHRDVELAKCQVLCQRCHAAKTWAYLRQRPWHGHDTMALKMKCSCAICKGRRAKVNRLRRERRGTRRAA